MVPTLEEELPKAHLIERNEPLRSILNQEVMEELRVCCHALSPPYDEIANLYFLEGKTAKEIAEQLGANVHTVQTQIYRAKEKLKKSYRKELLKE